MIREIAILKTIIAMLIVVAIIGGFICYMLGRIHGERVAFKLNKKSSRVDD